MSIPHVPVTASELEAAVRDGILTESLHFDAKRDLETGAKGNRALAVDMAAMAVNGGLLAIGVAEERGQSGNVLIPKPVALAGLRERISQIGLSRIDPPLTVVTRELPTGDAASGYLLILVPPSPDAPHMVDGQYRGRGDTTNYVMGDAEVRRVQAQRRGSRLDIRAELERAVAADPSPPELRTQAHLFIVARPLTPTSPSMLQMQIGPDWRKWIRETIHGQPSLGRYSPDLPGVDPIVRRPNGWAVASYPISATRTIDQDEVARGAEDDLLELEIDEDGSLRLFCGRGSDVDRTGVRWTFEILIAGLTWRVLRAASSIAGETGYVGNWDLGVALTNARGIASNAIADRMFREARLPFAADDYRSTTQATYAEITENRHAVMQRLLGRLNRALNDDVIPLPDFDAPKDSAPPNV